jgi:branched-chain amino acid transport system substrate-binding protein
MMMTGKMTRAGFLAGSIAVALGLGGSAAAQEVVKIGAAVSLTGNFAREGNLLKGGYAYWEKVVNEAGGIDVGGKKHKVQVIYYDDESKPQSSARLTEKLITEDNVRFILGPYSSGIATATAAISEKYKVVTMTPMATADSLYQRGYKFIFCPAPLASKTLDPMLDLLKGLPTPPQTIAIAGPDDLFPNVFAGAAQKKAEALGLKVVYNNKYPKGSVDLSSVATALKDANPDVLILTGYVQDSVLLVKSLQTLRVNPKLIGFAFAVGIPDVLNALGPASEDLFGVQIWDPAVKYKGPVIADAQAYLTGYEKAFGTTPNYITASGTAGALALQLAIEKAASLDPVKVRDAMLQLDVETFFGPFKFNETGVDEKASAVISQVQNGKAIPVYPKEIAAASVRYPRKPF